jgi:hypothetical protein
MFIVLIWTWMNTKNISFPLAYVSTGGLIQYLGHQLPAPRSQQGGAGWQCQRKETQRLHWNERSLLNPGRTILTDGLQRGWFPTSLYMFHWLDMQVGTSQKRTASTRQYLGWMDYSKKGEQNIGISKPAPSSTVLNVQSTQYLPLIIDHWSQYLSSRICQHAGKLIWVLLKSLRTSQLETDPSLIQLNTYRNPLCWAWWNCYILLYTASLLNQLNQKPHMSWSFSTKFWLMFMHRMATIMGCKAHCAVAIFMSLHLSLNLCWSEPYLRWL